MLRSVIASDGDEGESSGKSEKLWSVALVLTWKNEHARTVDTDNRD